MKKMFLIGLLSSATLFLWGQDKRLDYVVNTGEAERIVRVLASDDMRGRRVYSPEIEKAADFIEAEFKAIGLRTLDANDEFRQSFTMVRPKLVSVAATLNGEKIDPAKVIVITTQPSLNITKASSYEIATIGSADNLFQ